MDDAALRRGYESLLARRAADPADRIDCPPLERLVALVLREGTEEERLRLVDHIMACPACEPEFTLLRSVDRAAGPPCP